jgi:hypothetical protein
MAVAVELMAEFPGQEVTVLRVVAECADEHPEWDPEDIKTAARTRLTTWAQDHDDHAPAN